MLKKCADCSEFKPVSDFYSAKGYKDGIMSRCKSCHVIRTRALSRSPKRKAKRAEYNQLERVKADSRERRSKYRKLHPDKNQESKRVHRARKVGNGGKHTQEQWLALLDQVGNICVCCGASGKKLTRDHVVPLTAGGTDDITNIQPLCGPCNSSKGNRRSIDYRNGVEYDTILHCGIFERKCPDCKVMFKTNHKTKRFCSGRCRIHFHNKDKHF